MPSRVVMIVDVSTSVWTKEVSRPVSSAIRVANFGASEFDLVPAIHQDAVIVENFRASSKNRGGGDRIATSRGKRRGLAKRGESGRYHLLG